MKIRNSFVSNSSSCSFCVFGYWIDEPDSLDEVKEKLKGTDLSVATIGGVYEYGGFSLGMWPSKMKDEETVGEFKQRVLEAINKVLDKPVALKDLTWHIDGGYDG